MPTTRDILSQIHSPARSTYTTSADMTTAADITVAPPAGQRIHITDIMIASDTEMVFTFQEEPSATVLAAMMLFAKYTFMINPEGRWRVPTTGLKLQGKAGAAGNVYVTVWYYFE
jgi:hypothetical protein